MHCLSLCLHHLCRSSRSCWSSFFFYVVYVMVCVLVCHMMSVHYACFCRLGSSSLFYMIVCVPVSCLHVALLSDSFLQCVGQSCISFFCPANLVSPMSISIYYWSPVYVWFCRYPVWFHHHLCVCSSACLIVKLIPGIHACMIRIYMSAFTQSVIMSLCDSSVRINITFCV